MKNKLISLSLLIMFITFPLVGCGLTGSPRPRAGYLPTATVGIHFPNPDNLGSHSYGFGFGEAGGIVYTCKAGHVDLDHIRGNADQMRYLIKKIRKVLSKKQKKFSFSISGEMSSHKITLTYPYDLDNRAGKEQVIEEVAVGTAAYLVFNATVWHEMQTWFGVHFAGFEPEFNSAFSWEDTYSNLLGIYIGIEAMEADNFDKAMTVGIDKKLAELEVRPRSVAIAASDKVRGDWYTGNFIPNTKMRNFDIGLDGSVTPTLVPGIEGCNSQALPLAVPNLEVLKKYGFSMYYEIKPNVFEQGRMFKAAQSKKIVPEIHYPIMIEYIKKQASQKGYAYSD